MIFSHVLYQLSYLAIKQRHSGVAGDTGKIAKTARTLSITRTFRGTAAWRMAQTLHFATLYQCSYACPYHPEAAADQRARHRVAARGPRVQLVGVSRVGADDRRV